MFLFLCLFVLFLIMKLGTIVPTMVETKKTTTKKICGPLTNEIITKTYEKMFQLPTVRIFGSQMSIFKKTN